MNVGKICTRNTVTIREDKTVREAAKLMKEYNVGYLIATLEQKNIPIPAGILTDRDIVVKCLFNGYNINEVKVGEIMSTPVLTVSESFSILDTLMKMRLRYNSIRRIPVVDEKGHLTGVLSLDDILDYISKELNEITQIFHREEPLV
ncbi:CBS domain-containing protein [Chryseotalea sanaruensis]|uniref:CBS domain-containing protein n=1 Tax=Chryseotalea sanaruensis TaxID=2482724 RepID=A0A401U5Y9_9BACT|nr:CBS domain-containing protein [Chryseotalea sanaruensis]GCC50374.1 CBS domain-containing protein [Chryseotalea sanaruensis]